ncbi:MAG: bifunctional sugar-1-phosphate nucleotidylyltransferase/acetyltransferase [Candidatus Alkanophagales archaeon]
MIRQAIVLAAGEGQRLRPFTATKPKVMLPVANKPILEYVVRALAENNIRDIVLVVGYRKDKVMSYFGDGHDFGVRIRYVEQRQQLGTAHALRQAESLAAEEFLVISGDNIVDERTVAAALAAEKYSLLYKQHPEASKYGVLEVDSLELRDGMRVRRIVEKPKGGAEGVLVNIGIYVFDRTIFDEIDEKTDITDVLNGFVGRGGVLRAYEARGVWLDVVYPWDLLSVNDVALRLRTAGRALAGRVEGGVTIRGDVEIGEGSVIRANSYIVGPVVIGRNCEIGPNVCIFPATSIGNNVRIEAFTLVRNSVIMDDVSIGAGCSIKDSIIDRGCSIGDRFSTQSGRGDVKIDGEHHSVEAGAMLGECCVVGDSVVAKPCTILGNNVKVGDMKVVGGAIPDNSLVW